MGTIITTTPAAPQVSMTPGTITTTKPGTVMTTN